MRAFNFTLLTLLSSVAVMAAIIPMGKRAPLKRIARRNLYVPQQQQLQSTQSIF